ncbi:hypothetical protein BCR43DRAFT_526170 [Syncephalastrum racemosum]|uniref:Uncharacterized protein n=1 Tax=Syncephalastrum racemosum TaxID=13706 RepID=A0A1X2H948_SYNRA|nr:hypothetical protein BCR43DRAFT_526170 [Syncephalastrum racemosum]
MPSGMPVGCILDSTTNLPVGSNEILKGAKGIACTTSMPGLPSVRQRQRFCHLELPSKLHEVHQLPAQNQDAPLCDPREVGNVKTLSTIAATCCALLDLTTEDTESMICGPGEILDLVSIAVQLPQEYHQDEAVMRNRQLLRQKGIFLFCGCDKSSTQVMVTQAAGHVGRYVEPAKDLQGTLNFACYSSLYEGIFEETDGHAVKNKLKIGIKVFVDHVFNSIRPESATIFYRQDCMQEFFEAFHESSYEIPPVNISCLRQALAISYLDNTRTPDFSRALATFHVTARVREINNKDASKDWVTLMTFVVALKKRLTVHDNLPELAIAMIEDFS